MKKDPKIFIQHILESIEKIEEYTKNISEQEFLNSSQIQDAVIRRIEIIGEAVKNLPEEIKRKYPQIPWKRIAGMRDILIHGYFGVDLKRNAFTLPSKPQGLKACFLFSPAFSALPNSPL